MTAARDHVNLLLGGLNHARWPFASQGAEWLQDGYTRPKKQKANLERLA